jgi:hypothetical protein
VNETYENPSLDGKKPENWQKSCFFTLLWLSIPEWCAGFQKRKVILCVEHGEIRNFTISLFNLYHSHTGRGTAEGFVCSVIDGL